MRDVKERLLDIMESIERIERVVSRGKEDFFNDELVQTFIIHHVQILGEASSKLGRDFQDIHTELPWEQIVAMRNVLVHEYFGVDLNEVWSVVQNELPEFKRKIQNILSELSKES